MSAAAPADLDALSSLEDRIHRAVQLVMETRQRNLELTKQLDAVTAERNALTAEHASLAKERDQLAAERDSLLQDREAGATAASQAAKLSDELTAAKAAIEALTADSVRWKGEAEKLGTERNQVKTRIEKLLGQLDVLAST